MYAFSNTSCEIGVKALHVKSSCFGWSVTNDIRLSRVGDGGGLLDDGLGNVIDWLAALFVLTVNWLLTLLGVATWLALDVLGGVVMTFWLLAVWKKRKQNVNSSFIVGK